MRVVVVLDDGLYRALQERALRRGLPFQTVLNQAVEAGLAKQALPVTATTMPGFIAYKPGAKGKGRAVPRK